MQASPRNGASIDRIYVHTNEGPQGPGAARNLVGYLAHEDGGYQLVVDDTEAVRAAGDDVVLWSEGGDNTHAVAICFIGYAAFSAADWATPYSAAMLERGAQAVAAWCRQYNVPPVHVAPGAPGQAPTGRGIAEHADDHDPNSQGHTDPGAGFPIDAFIARVAAILAPVPAPPSPSVIAALKALAAFLAAVSRSPLHAGMKSPRVAQMNALLGNHGFAWCAGDTFGNDSILALALFKASKHLANRDGKVCGRAAALALLRK